jgi:hypothetical protein
MNATPHSIEVRFYNVGLGDCILLTFRSKQPRVKKLLENRILIDFGSTGRNPDGPTLEEVAHQLVDDCGGPNSTLDAVVITHRHMDHMSGFGGKAGEILVNQLRPKYILQPWTEDPTADDPTTSQTNSNVAAAQHVTSLRMGQEITDSILNEILARREKRMDRQTDDEAIFYCQKNLPFTEGKTFTNLNKPSNLGPEKLEGLNVEAIQNSNAISNIQNWSWKSGRNKRKSTPKRIYLQSQSSVPLQIPDLHVDVLGPLGPDQWSELKKHGNIDELWKKLAGLRKEGENELIEFNEELGPYGVSALFKKRHDQVHPNAPRKDGVRWLVQHLDELRGQQLLSFVRVLDQHLNNTSVVLMLDFGGFRMLFPGDAEVGAWQAMSENPDVVSKLRNVDLYKVGHHGSGNATPRESLWRHLTEERTNERPLHCVLSTQPTKFKGSIPNLKLLRTMTESENLHLVSTSYPEGEKTSEHTDDWIVHEKKFGRQRKVMSYSKVFPASAIESA